MKDLGLSKSLITAVSSIVKGSMKQQQEQSEQQKPAYKQHYGKLGAARPLSMEEAKAATQEAHAPARRVAATIRGMYVNEEKAVADPFEKETLKKRKERTAGEAVDEGKSHTVPKTAKEKALAALAAPKDKITHKDVLVGRGAVEEEEKDEQSKRASAWANMIAKTKETKTTGNFDKKKVSTGTVYTRKVNKDGTTKGVEESVEQIEEKNMDTPGNSTHQCAIHVKSAQFGEGRTLFSQHAAPAEDGTIEWYDVMFEHGIEKKVPTSELEILVTESHMNHKKKK